MVKYVCSKCNYRFEAESAKTCPYCGQEAIGKEKSAAELIDEVTSILER